MKTDFRIAEIEGRRVVIKGVGKMFYQDGFPISMSISVLKERGFEVSIFHIADECMKNGWSPKTTFVKLKEDFEDGFKEDRCDFEALKKFCYASYEDQREMIFNYLFGTRDVAKKWFLDNFKD
jgi:hypothetical protein